ncbi:hypothetical protein SLA2020_314060 [Shorea laevis]
MLAQHSLLMVFYTFYKVFGMGTQELSCTNSYVFIDPVAGKAGKDLPLHYRHVEEQPHQRKLERSKALIK